MATQHHLYIISSGPHIKVGYSTRPGSRVREIQTSNPLDCVLTRTLSVPRWKRCRHPGCVVCAKNFERQVHKQIAGWHARGEWYSSDSLPRVHQLFDEIEARVDQPPESVEDTERRRKFLRRQKAGLLDTPDETLMEELACDA